MNISANLIKYRKQYNYTQEQVAEMCNVSRQAYAKWESGESNPSLENVLVLSKVFNTTTDSLLSSNPIDMFESMVGNLQDETKHMQEELFGKYKGTIDIEAVNIEDVKEEMEVYFNFQKLLEIAFNKLANTVPENNEKKESLYMRYVALLDAASGIIDRARSKFPLKEQ